MDSDHTEQRVISCWHGEQTHVDSPLIFWGGNDVDQWRIHTHTLLIQLQTSWHEIHVGHFFRTSWKLQLQISDFWHALFWLVSNYRNMLLLYASTTFPTQHLVIAGSGDGDPCTARSDHRIQSEHQSLSTTSSKPLTAKSLLHYHLSSRQMPKNLVPNTKIVRMDVHPSHIWYIYIHISEIRSISALGMFHCDLRQVAFHGVKLVQQLGLCRLLVLRMSWIISGYTNFVKERLMTYSTIDGWSMLIMCFHERWIPSLLDQPGQYRSFCPLSSEQKPPWSARCLNYENHWPDRKQQTVSEWTDAS